MGRVSRAGAGRPGEPPRALPPSIWIECAFERGSYCARSSPGRARSGAPGPRRLRHAKAEGRRRGCRTRRRLFGVLRRPQPGSGTRGEISLPRVPPCAAPDPAAGRGRRGSPAPRARCGRAGADVRRPRSRRAAPVPGGHGLVGPRRGLASQALAAGASRAAGRQQPDAAHRIHLEADGQQLREQRGARARARSDHVDAARHAPDPTRSPRALRLRRGAPRRSAPPPGSAGRCGPGTPGSAGAGR